MPFVRLQPVGVVFGRERSRPEPSRVIVQESKPKWPRPAQPPDESQTTSKNPQQLSSSSLARTTRRTWKRSGGETVAGNPTSGQCVCAMLRGTQTPESPARSRVSASAQQDQVRSFVRVECLATELRVWLVQTRSERRKDFFHSHTIGRPLPARCHSNELAAPRQVDKELLPPLGIGGRCQRRVATSSKNL